MSTPRVSTTTALRLGWAVAEVRGRSWPGGPRPAVTVRPPGAEEILPLRSQRPPAASCAEAAASLVTLVASLGLGGSDFEQQLDDVLAPAGGTADPDGAGSQRWLRTARFFLAWDGQFQDDLTRRDEALANAYLLGRGLAECYWGLGAPDRWQQDGQASAVSPEFLLGAERHREITRMLGRYGRHDSHPMSAAVIAGTLEAWCDVADDLDRWDRDDLPRALYEQVRTWYQLLVLHQDPTTLVRPYARLGGLRRAGRVLRVFWAQVVLAVVALVALSSVLPVLAGPAPQWLSSVLATGGLGAIVLAAVLTRGRNAAQQLATRLRQDAYTDLVAVSLTVMPRPCAADTAGHRRAERRRTELAVRRRQLTLPTPAPG